MTVDSVSVSLARVAPVVIEKVSPWRELNLAIMKDKCSLSIPSGSVDKSMKISSCLLTDKKEYESQCGAELTDIVQLLPHNARFKKAATLRLLHGFELRQNHAISVTLLYSDVTDSTRCIKPLWTFTSLEEEVSLQFGRAVLLADQIVVQTTTFFYICCRNDACCVNLSALLFSPEELKSRPFGDNFSVKLSILEKGKEEMIVSKERGTGPQAYEIIQRKELSFCDCAISKDKPHSPEWEEEGGSSLVISAEMKSASVWHIDASPRKIPFNELRAISKSEAAHRTYIFDISRSVRSPAVSNSMTVGFDFKWKKPIEPLCVTFTASVDREVTEKELHKLAVFLPDCWKSLSRELPGQKEDVAVVERKCKDDPKELPYCMLKEWHNRNGSRATVRDLCTALISQSVGHRRAAEETFGKECVEEVSY